MTSLLKFIHHKPVAAPTYFDLLPIDVLRHHLMPFLGWEDRIHLNQMFPPADRILPNKIPKSSIAEHQLVMTVPVLRAKLRKVEDIQHQRGHSKYIEVAAIIDVLETMASGPNMIACQYSSSMRRAAEEKCRVFIQPAELKKIPRIAQRKQMEAVVAKLSAKLAQYPLLADLNVLGKKKWMRERVTQNETALFAAGDGAGGSYRRRQGDIYSVME
uniref:Uncharacterized protein n=1 Tax=viral metagenome TaxID=1070528 RepID=A0A6C0F3B9_9ZZZZ